MANTQDATCFLVQGSCFCGQVTFGAIAPPVLSAYCHCTQCQKLTACPLVHTMHFMDTDFRWTTTGDPPQTDLDTYDNPLKPHKRRYRCKTCGVCAVSYNRNTRRFSVYAGAVKRDADGKILNWEIIKPTAHQFYGTRVMDIEDGLDKWEGYEGNSTRLG
ncbi:Mss4-like protein [Pisolithus albus]|nr:Mss4-like protein [Pisolithus albus]